MSYIGRRKFENNIQVRGDQWDVPARARTPRAPSFNSKPVEGVSSQLGAETQNTQRHFSKFGNQRTEVDGILFSSKKEAARWLQLKLLERAGKISGLLRQVRYELYVSGEKIATYVCDFQYTELRDGAPWQVVTEDTKGFRTPVYKLKAKLFKAIYGRSIVET